MARGTGTVLVKFLGDTSDLKKAAGDAEDHLGKVGSAVGSMAKSALMVGVPALAGFGVAAVKAFSESEKVAAQTGAVLKSTGNAAHVTAQQVGGLADSLSKMSGVDDEAIQSGENLLLTFTNVQNKAGKGNDIFSQATQTMLDMSTALGQDTSASAIQLGKALNDPIKGVTALQRVGVSFTEKQKDQIKTLVESGHTMEAQKLILKELQTEFGGSAKAAGETFAGQIGKLKVALGNFMEDVGSKIVPVLMSLGKWLGDNVPKAIAVLSPYLAKLSDAAKELAGWFSDNVVPVLEKLWGFIQDNVQPVMAALAVVVGVALVGAVVALGGAIAGLLSPFVLIVGALALVAAGLVYAYNHFEVFHDVVDAVASFFTDKVVPAIKDAVGVLSEQFGHLADWVREVWPAIQEAIGHVLDVVKGYIDFWVGAVGMLWHQWGDDILHVVQTAWDLIKSTIDNFLQVIRGIIQTVTSLINGDWGKAWDGFKQILAGVWDQIFALIRASIETVKSLLGGIASTVGEIAEHAFDALKNAFRGAINWIIDRWNGLEFKAPHLPGMPDVTIGGPDIPRLASGGPFNGLAVVGEAGPELIAGSGTVIPNSQLGGTVIVNFNAPMDRAGVAREIEGILTDFVRQGGNLRFT